MYAEVTFNDALEASAYVVLLVTMAGKEYAPNVKANQDGTFVVELVKPVPIDLHNVILSAIKHDQEANPAKWAKTREELNHGKTDVCDVSV